ncbi:response regulator transcription factor [Cellulosimicrobium terreum]|nr:response regulator transcription factor [Cellulosimicrobium terreum]
MGRLQSGLVTGRDQDAVLGPSRSARGAVLRRAREVLVLDAGGPGTSGTTSTGTSPLWVRVHERAHDQARVRVVVSRSPWTELQAGDGVPANLRVDPHLRLTLVVLDSTAVLVALPGRTRAVVDRVAVHALRTLAESTWEAAQPDLGLAPDEQAVLHLLAEGKTDTAVANRLGISPRTVRRVASTLMVRLGATSRFEAGVRAAQRGWIRLTDR